MARKAIVSIMLSMMLLFSGCIGGDSTVTDDVTDIDDTPVDPSNPDLYEGDDAGECTDGADNDQDGLFDCNDPNCSGSPDCATPGDNNTQPDDNNTQPDDNNTQPDDNNTQPDDNNTQPDDNNTQPQGWEVVNLTDEMILAGDLDSSECGILLFGAGWDGPSANREGELRNGVLNTSTPTVNVWIATYEDAVGNTLLPSLYDWRNGEIDHSIVGMVYVIDSDEVLMIEHIFGDADLGTICLPSQRDSILRLFETINPTPPPFAWSIPILTSNNLTDARNKYDNGDPICEVIAISPYYTYPMAEWVGQWHDDLAAAIEGVGETDVNLWFLNLTDEDGNMSEVMMDWAVTWHDDPMIIGELGSYQFIILDNANESTLVGANLYAPLRNHCDSDSRENVYQFLYNMDITVNFGYDILIEATNESLTSYELAEMSIDWGGEYNFHEDMELTCDLSYWGYQFTNHRWTLNGVQIQIGGILNLSDYGAQVGDIITCIWDGFDTTYNASFTAESSEITIVDRVLLVHGLEITPENGTVTDSIECNASVQNPHSQNYVMLYNWVVDITGEGNFDYDDWWSTYSTNNTFNPDSGETGQPAGQSVQVEKGQALVCYVELYSPEDAQLMMDGPYDQDVWARHLSRLGGEFIFENTAPTIGSIDITPNNGIPDDTYQCSVQTSDVDNDSISIVYQWYVNGALTTVTNQFFDGKSENLQSGDELKCIATASDGDGGTDTASASVTVQ